MTDYVHRIDDDEHARIKRFLRWFAAAAVIFMLTIIALVATADRWLKLISIESERRFIEPYIDLMLKREWIDSDPELQHYVSELAAALGASTPLDSDERPEITVYVVDSDIVNAFATLGGYVFVFDGLVGAVENENSLAMVLGHEIGHVYHRDPLLGTGRGMLIQLALSALSGNGMDPNAANLGGEVILASYSREQEIEADEFALRMLQNRYGHIGGSTRLFEIIREQGDDAAFAEFLSTHPNTDARIGRIRELASANGWVEKEPAPYPDAVLEVLRN